MDESSKGKGVEANLRLNDEASARRRIVSRVGEIIQGNPDKFRVVNFNFTGELTLIAIETILVYEDGEVALRVELEKGEHGQTESKINVYDGSRRGRKIIYRLDITRQIANEMLGIMKKGAEGEGKDADTCRTMLEDWMREVDGSSPPLLVDRFGETLVVASSIRDILESFDGIKLPELALGAPFDQTLQQFFEVARRQNGGDSKVAKLLS